MTELFRFVSGPLPGTALTATYDGWLVALSYLVAALASYTAIDLANRVREFRAEPHKAAAWVIGGAVAMGAGVWSMHFVAMLAYQLPLPVRYEWWSTLASMIAAMLTSGFALYIVTHYTLTRSRLALSGAVMGAGIGAMHYIGMAAMRLDALVMYYAGPFALSVLNAIVCSTAALWLVARRAEATLPSRMLAALVMGVAVAGMHYTGMYATVCVATGDATPGAGGLDPALLAVVITAITLLIMGMALTVSLQTQLLSRALREQNLLLHNEIEHKRRVEVELQAHRDNLQSLIDERTAELERSNRVLAQRTDEVLRITQMSNLLQTADNMQEAGEILSRMMQPLLLPHAGAIYLTAASLNRLDRLSCWGDTPHAAAIAPDECWALRRGGLYGASNTAQEMYCAHVHETVQHMPYLCVPMMAHGVSLGLLHVSFAGDAAGAPAADDEHLRVQRITDQVTLALANVKLRQSLREQSIRDLLTGLYNRRYLEESLDREIARARRENTPLAVIMLDVDHFKHFNDQYGHEGGDAVLQMLGRVLREAARASDIVARYGGEEFTVLLPNASAQGAHDWAERLRQNVRCMEVKSAGQTFPPISISLGLALYGESGMTGEHLLRAADIALYDAKRRGRDRLVVAGARATAATLAA